MSVKDRITQWVRPEVQALSAYHVADAAGLIKLDAMENPFDFPAALKAELGADLRDAAINRYPDPDAGAIRAALRELYSLPDAVDMLFGNGSDEIIQILAMAVAGPGRTILSVEPSFVMYKMIATFIGAEYVGVPLNDEFQIDAQATLDAIKRHQPALVFIAQPNNPTGNLFDDETLRQIVAASPGLVVIDEAYTAFTDADYMSWASEYDNVVIMRTFSKVGLAGLRFGMLFGPQEWIEQLNKVRLPYNINCLTQNAVLTAIRHFPEFVKQTEALREQRSWLNAQLGEVAGVTVYPSEANFILVRLDPSAKSVFNEMKKRGVLIKLLDGGHPKLAGCLRLTVGGREENEAMLKALIESLEAVRG
ncbi:histidinol-phosphate transaminase [Hahella sp. KA22]|uniref:histidinol-phosphate transaminase n=1 Tax=Hahella sp. KA22 TaxID=1628392 RepID=UPI000FDD179B|nr:histidinol-phosphate transaminase [Hahella sp. KA22]AZZ90870.1 histidinol-phosphate transaminase [Hahella sp. KA22]QAY54240.1 histidinol-phosphate transaminase [Hahella sp. KA22]